MGCFGRCWIIIIGTVLAVLSGSSSACAASQKVDLELALGADVSGSVDDEEAALQREGYIRAFRHPQIIRAILSGYHRRIAVGYFEWAGYGHNKIVVDWTLIDSAATAIAFAEKLTKIPPETASRTSLSGAISFAADWFDQNKFLGRRRVVDLSGDGPNNWGELVTLARDRAVAKGVTINGLPIINLKPSPYGTPQIETLDLYFRHCVIGGRSAFIEVAKDFKDFSRAIRRKLILEISGIHERPRQPPGIQLAQSQLTTSVSHKPGVPRVVPPCNIGELIRMHRDDDDF
ncbi:MAG: DUF1194 domain-containing protein [Rhodospirillaceae bacterium]|jgi:hypothetical protein